MDKLIVSFVLVMLMSFPFSGRSNTTTTTPDTVFVIQTEPGQNTEVLINKDTLLQKRIVASLFSFPFPFGFMGAHRVMLGTKPWIPVVYAATFGGCFGLLPLIDFCVLTFSKDISAYENNPHVFMWIKSHKEEGETE